MDAAFAKETLRCSDYRKGIILLYIVIQLSRVKSNDHLVMVKTVCRLRGTTMYLGLNGQSQTGMLCWLSN